jgi:hypothetical protein
MRQNVEIVRSIYPAPEVDLVPLVRNDDHWRGFAEAISPAREGSAEEVKGRVANIWFIRDGRIASVDGYTTHEEAFRDLGVKE